MRAVAILALAALLCTAASATVTVATTQAQAKALKDTWPACSSIVKGRLGSLTSFNATTDAPYVIDATVYNGNVSSGTVHYTPCTTSVADFNNNKANLQVNIATMTKFAGHPPSPVNAAYNVDSTVFSMPTQKGDVPKFIASMTIVTDASTGPHNAVVTTLCAPTDNNGALSTGNYSISADGLTLNIQLTDMNACPRFPYTNEAMPSGAIAALIVVIACFVIQFGICGWYHMTHKQDTPFTEHQVE